MGSIFVIPSALNTGISLAYKLLSMEDKLMSSC
jgi:hypothetical protein